MLLRREIDRDESALPLFAAEMEACAVSVDHPADERESETAAALFGGEEAAEGAVTCPHVHARPGVANADANIARGLGEKLGGDGNRPATLHRFTRVSDHVLERETQEVRVDVDRRKAVFEPRNDFDGTVVASIHRTDRSDHERIDFGAVESRLEARHSLVVGDESLDAIDLLDDDAEHLALVVDRTAALSFLLEELRRALDGGQRIPDVVCHLAREPAERQQLVRAGPLLGHREGERDQRCAEKKGDHTGAENDGSGPLAGPGHDHYLQGDGEHRHEEGADHGGHADAFDDPRFEDQCSDEERGEEQPGVGEPRNRQARHGGQIGEYRAHAHEERDAQELRANALAPSRATRATNRRAEGQPENRHQPGEHEQRPDTAVAQPCDPQIERGRDAENAEDCEVEASDPASHHGGAPNAEKPDEELERRNRRQGCGAVAEPGPVTFAGDDRQDFGQVVREQADGHQAQLERERVAGAPRRGQQREREECGAGSGRQPNLGRHAGPRSPALRLESRTKSPATSKTRRARRRARNLLALVARRAARYAPRLIVKADERGRAVLVVDDDVALGKVLVGLLSQAGLSAKHARSGEEALATFATSACDLVITDLRMPGMDGLSLVRELKRVAHDIPVILLTAHGSIPLAVEALRAGAADFLTKPFDREEIVYTVHKALRLADHAADRLPDRAAAKPVFGSSAPMREVAELVRRAAKTSSNVLLRGESGTGKEVAARTIHTDSQRGDGPFVAVNCAALPEQLLESELFGYEKGAFTGAVARRPGRVELARGGTLFLDEIGDVPPPAQAKLLRLLQEKEFQPLGGTRTEKADVRFIAATHRDLEGMVASGQFREDLYYRLNVIPVWLPPLRDRPGDVTELGARFAEALGAENGRPNLRLDDRALARLKDHLWPGNVRELMCVIERLIVFTDADAVTEADVTRELDRIRAPGSGPALASNRRAEDDAQDVARPGGGDDTLASRRLEAERGAVEDALRRAGQNRTQAARLLGVSRRTLYKRLAALGMGAD